MTGPTLSEHTGIDDLVQLLNLIAQSSGTTTNISLLEVTRADTAQAPIPQLTNKQANQEDRQSGKDKSSTQSNSDSAVADENVPDEEMDLREAQTAKKHKRRRPKFSDEAVRETDQPENTSSVAEDKADQTRDVESEVDTTSGTMTDTI